MFDPSSDSEEYDAYERQLGPNPSLALAQYPQIEQLRTTLIETLPYCCGTLVLPTENLMLYYGKTELAKRLDLLHASEAALADLEATSEPATFRGVQRDVLNTTDRKARKLDPHHFAVNLDIERSGVLEAVRTGLFTSKEQNRSVRAELYDLNIYGKGSSVRAHNDRNRSASMFASLVLVFPTPHAGGALALQQDGGKWAFDAASVLQDASRSGPRVAYIALFSDVEHEVAQVTSGHRVTITYNLYYADEAQHTLLERVDVIQPRGARGSEVKSTLASLLEDKSFLPSGGTLGFGLRHVYTFPASFDAHEDNTLDTLRDQLKGVDAALFYTCSELLVSPSFYTIYEENSQVGADGRRALIACPRVVKFHSHDMEEEPPVWEKLCRNWDGVLVNFPPEQLASGAPAGGGTPIQSWAVHWITPLSEVNRVKTRFAAYAKEPMIGYLYQRICMLVKVGPTGSRLSV